MYEALVKILALLTRLFLTKHRLKFNKQNVSQLSTSIQRV